MSVVPQKPINLRIVRVIVPMLALFASWVIVCCVRRSAASQPQFLAGFIKDMLWQSIAGASILTAVIALQMSDTVKMGFSSEDDPTGGHGKSVAGAFLLGAAGLVLGMLGGLAIVCDCADATTSAKLQEAARLVVLVGLGFTFVGAIIGDAMGTLASAIRRRGMRAGSAPLVALVAAVLLAWAVIGLSAARVAVACLSG